MFIVDNLKIKEKYGENNNHIMITEKVYTLNSLLKDFLYIFLHNFDHTECTSLTFLPQKSIFISTLNSSCFMVF